jgi:hypothetical protein
MKSERFDHKLPNSRGPAPRVAADSHPLRAMKARRERALLERDARSQIEGDFTEDLRSLRMARRDGVASDPASA